MTRAASVGSIAIARSSFAAIAVSVGCASPPSPGDAPRPPPAVVPAAPSASEPATIAPARARIAVGARHSCAIRASGRVACWGSDDAGQLGDSSRAPRATPVEIPGVEGAVQIDAEGDSTCVAAKDGRVLCWGGGEATAPRAIADVIDAVEVAIGDWHTCAVIRSGKVRCWGRAWLGDGVHESDRKPSLAAASVEGIDDAVAVRGSCVLRRAGEVRCWGLNGDGELGDGTRDSRPTPVPVQGLTDAVAIATASTHACALRRGGQVVCWGRAEVGQLGDGIAAQRRLGPAPVAGIDDGVAIAADGMNTCVIRRTGAVACWGGNAAFGQLGEARGSGYGMADYGTSVPIPASVPDLADAVEIAIGPAHACARRASGEIACWGDNLDGELGGGFAGRVGPFSTVEGLADATRVAVGDGFACAIRGGGDVACWGSNRVGQLGDGTRKSRGTPAPVRGVTGATAISVSAERACVVVKPGAIRCWGWAVPEVGARGDDEFAFMTAKPVTRISDAVEVSTDNFHTCARRRIGEVDCWGDDPHAEKNVPTKVPGIPDAVAQESSAFGGCAVRRAGSLVCWGIGAITAMEPPTPADVSDRTKPTLLRGIGDVTGVGFGSLVTCLLRRSGRVHCWGTETVSLLPDNPLPKTSEVTGLSDGAAIRGTLVIRAGGELVSLENDPRDEGRWAATPLLPEIHDAIDASGRRDGGCAVRRGGAVVCWGDDATGMLGAGAKARSPVPIKVALAP